MLENVSRDTLSKLQEAAAQGFIKFYQEGPGRLAKSIDLGTNLQGTPLEAPAKLLVPLLSPFRQSIARETIGQRTQSYKRITAVTLSGGFFPAEKTKANKFSLTTDTKTVTFTTYGRGSDVSWESRVAGRAYEDVRARDEAILSLALLREEELNIIGGNITALGAPTGFTSAAAAGGSLADATYKVIVFALTLESVGRCSKLTRPSAAGCKYDFLASGPPTADGSVGFSAGSAEQSVATSGGNNSVSMTWTPIPGAAAYAIYAGTTTGITNLKLQGIVTQAKCVMTSISTTGQAGTITTDTSANSRAFDGIIPQLAEASSNAYKKNVGSVLSAASGNQIAEIQAGLDDIYDRTKTEPDRLLMGWQEKNSISQKLISVANDRLTIQIPAAMAESGDLPTVEWYKSPRGKRIRLEENPNMPGGMILGLIDSVPYPNSEIPSPWKMWMGSDLTRLDYALTIPADEYEIRAFGALAGYAPALQGLWYNVFGS